MMSAGWNDMMTLSQPPFQFCRYSESSLQGLPFPSVSANPIATSASSQMAHDMPSSGML
jgi:hypothetical protein